MKRMIFIVVGLLFFGVATAHISSASVNINKADIKELITLKGIGSKKAEAIIANRKQAGLFHSINDLTRIKGIGKKFLQRVLERNPGRIKLKGGTR